MTLLSCDDVFGTGVIGINGMCIFLPYKAFMLCALTCVFTSFISKHKMSWYFSVNQKLDKVLSNVFPLKTALFENKCRL